MEEITTSNYIGESDILSVLYPNRRKLCVACGCVYFVSLKKTIGTSKYCGRICSNKNQKRGDWNKGRKLSASHKIKLSEGKRGCKSHLWKGGITPINASIRSSKKMRDWRKAVFERDNFTCKECGLHGVYLEADHIKSFADYPDLRFELTNGRTLCRECHKKTDTYAGKGRWKKQNG